MGGPSKLIREIHRRSLWQVLGIYLAASWGALQIAETVVETAGLPDWLPGAALVVLVVLLPVVLATAFVQEGVGTAPPEGAGPGSRERTPAHRVLTWRRNPECWPRCRA